MSIQDSHKKCSNCSMSDYVFRRGYCTKCYTLIIKIRDIDKGILPGLLEHIISVFGSCEKAKEEYIRQIKNRLQIRKESYSFKYVSAHELEHRINSTLMILDRKSLGKFNDPIASYLKDDTARSYVFQLFSKIQLLKPFKVDIGRLYEVESKHRKTNKEITD